MITEIEVTVGDTGITLSGQLNGGGLTTLAGCTVTLSLLGVDDSDELRLTGKNVVVNQAATVTDSANRRVSYKLTTAVAARARTIIRWTVALPASAGNISFPGKKSDQTVLIINP